MKVLQVGKFYPPYRGGMETVLKNLCEGLESEVDIAVLVANTSFKTSRENLTYPVTRAASLGNFFSTSLCPTFPYWMKKIDADIIHIHMPNPLAEMSYLMLNNKYKLVTHFHSVIERQKHLMPLYGPFLNKFFDKADRIIAPTPNHITISPLMTLFREKCEVIPFGISLNEFKLDDEQAAKVSKLKGELPTLLFVGRLVYYKGLDILIRVMSNIKARLWIVGTGPLESLLKKITADLNLQQKIDFLGDVKHRDLVCYYHACDIFVLPSIANSEMFGIVQLEAMACKKPVIATNLPTGVSWVNQDGVTGVLVPPGDIDALSQAARMLIENPSLCNKMGKAGRKRVEENFTRDKMVKGILKVYKEII